MINSRSGSNQGTEVSADEETRIYSPDRAATSNNAINVEQIAIKIWVILYVSIKRRVILYMGTYIFRHTNIVPWINRVYQQISTKIHSILTHSPIIQYFLTGQFTPYSPFQNLLINELKIFSWPMAEEEYPPLFAVN